MELKFTAEELAFKKEVAAFIQANYSDDDRKQYGLGMDYAKDVTVKWQRALAAKGWVAPGWPREWGGTQWTPTQSYIFEYECAMANTPEIFAAGLKMVAPVIIAYGNDEQKKRFLPEIYNSNIWWCQGYSEPGAGSDLASLQTKAVREGDHYIVNGSKIWTSTAHYADWIFCLVRTDPGADIKQKGISFLLIDMKTPGIRVEPIIGLDGRHQLNQTFFDDVKVPVTNLIGEENKGWTYAKVLLTHERTSIARVARSKYKIQRLKEMASVAVSDGQPLIEDKSFKQKLNALEVDMLALEYSDLRILSDVKKGGAPAAESSILKIRGSELQQAIAELTLEVAGYYSQPYVSEEHVYGYEGERTGDSLYTATALWYFNSRPATVYGGSNEIQRNILAKAVLGL